MSRISFPSTLLHLGSCTSSDSGFVSPSSSFVFINSKVAIVQQFFDDTIPACSPCPQHAMSTFPSAAPGFRFYTECIEKNDHMAHQIGISLIVELHVALQSVMPCVGDRGNPPTCSLDTRCLLAETRDTAGCESHAAIVLYPALQKSWLAVLLLGPEFCAGRRSTQKIPKSWMLVG